jgi:hypothetical protein
MQAYFDSDGMAALKPRGPKAKALSLVVVQEEWQLCAPERRPLEFSELPFKIPGVWAEDNLPGLARNVFPVVMELKLGDIPISQK